MHLYNDKTVRSIRKKREGPGSQEWTLLSSSAVIARNFFSLLVFFGSLSAQSALAVPCREIFEGRTDAQSAALVSSKISVSRDFFTASDRNKIEEVLQNRTTGRRDIDYEALLQIYVERRLAEFPKTIFPAVQKQMDDFQLDYVNYQRVPLTAQVDALILPMDLKNTPVAAMIRAHELEHMIQRAEMNPTGSKDVNTQIMDKALTDPKFRFRIETEAMTAEWHFLSILPKSIVEMTLESLAESRLLKADRESLEGVFKNAHLALREYLDSQRAAARYSMKDILMDTHQERMKRSKHSRP